MLCIVLQPRRSQTAGQTKTDSTVVGQSSSAPSGENFDLEQLRRAVLVDHSYFTPVQSQGELPADRTSSNSPGPSKSGGALDWASVPDVAAEEEFRGSSELASGPSDADLVADNVRKDLELCTLRNSRSDLDLALSSQSSRVVLAKKLGQLENEAVLRGCQLAIAEGPKRRSLDALLATPTGRLTNQSYNPVVEAFVDAVTEEKGTFSSAASSARHLRRQVRIESLYSARHLNYVSGFFPSLQAVVYAICGSKTAVDIIGHLGPGCSYHLMKDWLQEMASEKVVIPSGFITVSFDNEQRLLKNWLARGSNRSAIEVLTNIVCANHNENSKDQENPFFH